MSGLEVVGVVLGSIPLVISALEHYGQGLSTLQRWRKYERELRSLIRNLETERLKLQNVCEKLLVGLVPPSKIEAMINQPLGDMWKEDETKRKIRVRLWKGFDVFESTVGDVKAAVDEMSERIESQSGGRVSSEVRRAIFTFSRTQYDDLLKTIRESISNLENMTDRNLELEPARKARSQGKFFMLFRDMSNSLYQALRSSLGCSCDHDVSLRLETRAAEFVVTDREEEILSHMDFKLALSSGDSTAALTDITRENCARCWEEFRVAPRTASALATAASQHKLPNGSRPSPSWQSRTNKTKKSVGFTNASISLHSTQRKNITTTGTGNTLIVTSSGASTQDLHKSSITLPEPTSDSVYLEHISSLCKKIQKLQANHNIEAYGTIADLSHQTVREYTVYPLLPSRHKETTIWSVVSLREILESKDDSLYLPYHNRLRIAVIISSSILQLYGSPWLPEVISSRDIFFVTKHGFPIYDYPLVMKSMTTSTADGESNGQSDSLPYNTTLLSLGILLVELIIGSTLDSFQASREEGPVNSQLLTQYITAQKLLDQDQAKMPSSNYEAAVRRCLGGLHSGQKDLEKEDLEKEDYCQDVYSGVVALLDKDLEYLSYS